MLFGWVAVDEAYGQARYVRVWLEERRRAHVLATKRNDILIIATGREARADQLVAALPVRVE
ncbi:hypothetical protein AB1484_30010 [Parafrankia sp. FMc6]|uniref:hypothetical protein n=1 Tax=Parafrankia soli TaxID=2599596 RepID=UPI0034D7918C